MSLPPPLRLVACLATLLTVTGGCATPSSGGGVGPGAAGLSCTVVDADRAEAVGEVADTFRAWRAALAASDPVAVAALVTDDALFWSAAQPELRGRAAVVAAFEPVFAAWTLVQEFACDELRIEDDLAFARGTEHNVLTPLGGGEAAMVEQRAFSVLSRGEDGRWRFWRGMTNAPPAG